MPPFERNDDRTGAAIVVAGGLSLVAYSLSKQWFIGPDARLLPFVPAGQSGRAYHLLETVPVVLLLAGLVALYLTHQPLQSPVEASGYAVAAAALVGVNGVHWAEHLLPVLLGPDGTVRVGSSLALSVVWLSDLFMWLYYGAWFAFAAGLSLVGIGIRGRVAAGRAGASRVLGTLFASALPIGVVLGVVVVSVGLGSTADGFKMAEGVVLTGVGAVLARDHGRAIDPS